MIIGTAGHIDHGKTALVGALTGVDTDRLGEEKRRGMSIDLGFAYLPAPDGGVLGFVDVPGHERFLHNMLAGFVGIDLALLVVACDDGVMPQTVEHLAIVDLLGIGRGIVALTKTDLVSAARRHEVAEAVAALLNGTGLAGAAMVEVSTRTGEGVDALRKRLFAEASAVPPRPAAGRFRLPVDRCFTLAGVGTVVTGTVVSGRIAVGDRVTVSPSGLVARVRSIHAQNRPAERGRAGERCALSLVGPKIAKQTISRGQVVLDARLHASTSRIDAVLRVAASEPRPVTHWMPVRLHHATEEVGARVALLGDPVPPRREGYVQLVLERPIAALSGDRFIVRDTSARRTIGGGCFADLRAPGRRRRTPLRRARVEAHALADPERALAALLDCEPYYVDLGAFARDHGLADEECDAILARLGIIAIAADGVTLGLARSTWSRRAAEVLDALEKFHADRPQAPGATVGELRGAVGSRLAEAAFASLVRMLAQEGRLVIDGTNVRLPGHRVGPTGQEKERWARIAPLLSGEARFRPPRVAELAANLGVAEKELRRLLKSVEKRGQVDEVAPDHFFLRETVVEMAGIAADIAASSAGGRFVAAQFRDRLENGRKVAIRILEFFDRRGITMRRGDERSMNPHRSGEFRAPPVTPAPAKTAASGRESSPVGRPDFKSAGGP